MAVSHPASGATLIKDSRLGSAQLPELVVVQMAVQNATARDKPLVHISTDSQALAN